MVSIVGPLSSSESLAHIYQTDIAQAESLDSCEFQFICGVVHSVRHIYHRNVAFSIPRHLDLTDWSQKLDHRTQQSSFNDSVKMLMISINSIYSSGDDIREFYFQLIR